MSRLKDKLKEYEDKEEQIAIVCLFSSDSGEDGANGCFFCL